MNQIDIFVKEIIGEPFLYNNKWFLEIMADAYGHIDKHTLMFFTKEEALNVKVGDKFLA